jgi:HD-like signal output (HDOD) protein
MDYQYSHARVGYALARGWLLPEPFCVTIFTIYLRKPEEFIF